MGVGWGEDGGYGQGEGERKRGYREGGILSMLGGQKGGCYTVYSKIRAIR